MILVKFEPGKAIATLGNNVGRGVSHPLAYAPTSLLKDLFQSFALVSGKPVNPEGFEDTRYAVLKYQGHHGRSCGRRKRYAEHPMTRGDIQLLEARNSADKGQVVGCARPQSRPTQSVAPP